LLFACFGDEVKLAELRVDHDQGDRHLTLNDLHFDPFRQLLVSFAQPPLFLLAVLLYLVRNSHLLLLHLLALLLLLLLQRNCLLRQGLQIGIGLTAQQVNALLILLDIDVGFSQAVVGLCVCGVVGQTFFAILDHFSEIFVAEVDHGSVGMQFC
jgi:hypothetical protein